MDDLIDDVGIDAKHSFEDKILPVEEAYRRWGDRIAILGGVDMDVLGRGTEEQVRARTRQILEVCGVKGTGYCLGTGNSVPPTTFRCRTTWRCWTKGVAGTRSISASPSRRCFERYHRLTTMD